MFELPGSSASLIIWAAVILWGDILRGDGSAQSHTARLHLACRLLAPVSEPGGSRGPGQVLSAHGILEGKRRVTEDEALRSLRLGRSTTPVLVSSL